MLAIQVIGLLFLFGQVSSQNNQCEAFIDLALIIDSSGSIQPNDFEEGKKALLDLVSRLNVATEKAGVAIINYASTVDFDARTDVYEFDRGELMQHIAALPHLQTNTATGEALAVAKAYCDASCRQTARAIPRVFTVITDGHSNEGRDVLEVAKEIRESSTEGIIFAIGIGNIGTDGEAELLGIAGDPDYVMRIGSYLDFARVVNVITTKMCEFPAFVLPDVQIVGEALTNSTRYYRMHTLNKLSKNAFFEIEIRDRTGKVAVYSSTTNKKPSAPSARTFTSRANGNSRTYTTFVPANAKNFYFGVKGLSGSLNQFDFTVRVRPM